MTRQTDNDSQIHTSNANPGDISIQVSYPTGMDGDRVVRLEITDRMSGQALVRAALTSAQFTEILSATGTVVSGAVLPVHPERIGKRMQNVSTNIKHGDDREAEAVRDAYLADGWETARIDRTNFGRRVVAYRWISDDKPEGSN